MDIRNMPAEAAYYEFVVAIPNADHYTFLGMYADGYLAENAALEYGGIVIHNVRIQGYQPPKPESEKKYYVFSGVWSYGCWATNADEAHDIFDDANLDDFDIDFSHVEMEVEED